MKQDSAIEVLRTLASGPRLDIYRLLVRAAPRGRVAGDIGRQLGLPPTNLSFHLKALTHAGLLRVEAEGRYQRYRANLALVRELIAYLTEECCTDRPQDCTAPACDDDCAESTPKRRSVRRR